MRPKPTREWVMLELERLGVRVVSGRIGRQGAEQEDDSTGGNGGGNVAGGTGAAGGGGPGGGGMSGNILGVSTCWTLRGTNLRNTQFCGESLTDGRRNGEHGQFKYPISARCPQ